MEKAKRMGEKRVSREKKHNIGQNTHTHRGEWRRWGGGKGGKRKGGGFRDYVTEKR
jgi:hypothetical protein